MPSSPDEPQELARTVSELVERLHGLTDELVASKAQQKQENNALKHQMNAINQAHEQESLALKQELHALKQQVHDQRRAPPMSAGTFVPQNPTAGPATSPPSRPRRHLVVCIDGTSNQFSHKNTNVVELYHRLVKDDTQLTFYNSGIGTYATPSWKSVKYLKQVLDNKIDLAVAWNYDDILRSAYRWLSENYEDGDLVFLFGFSRGAYQIRTLAAMIDSVGLIRKGNLDQIPFAYELYAETRKFPKAKISKRRALRNATTAPTNTSAPLTTTEGASASTNTADNENGNLTVNHPATTKKESEVQEMCRRFKETFSRKPFKVHFAGAWDTVSSVGFVRDKTLPGTTDGMQHVTFFRHALALHERRIKFLQENVRGGLGPTDEATRPGKNGEPAHTKEVWFAGSHGDIGGGAVSNLAMDQFGPSLRWMMFEAAVAGLRLSDVPQKWEDTQLAIHNSMSWPWYPFEYLPFTRLTYKGETETTSCWHRARPRKIQPGQLIHSTALDSQSLWRARLHSNIDWDSTTLKGLHMVENDPYSEATTLIHDINEFHSANSADTLSDYLVNGLRSLIATEPGRRSLRDTPGAGDILMNGMGRYSLGSADGLTAEALCVVADAALAALDREAVEDEDGDKYYPAAQVRPIVMRARQKDEAELAERLEELFGPAQVQAPLRHPRGVNCVSYMPDGKRIVSGCDDGAVRIWDVKTGKIVGAPMTGHTGPVWSMAVSADGTQIASGSLDETVRVWNAVTGAMVALLEGHDLAVFSIAFSPDGRCVASGLQDGTIRVRDVASAKTVVGPIPGDRGSVLSVALSPDGTRIASGAEGAVCVWNAETGENVWRTETSSTVYSVSYSPDIKRIVAGCGDHAVRVLDAETGKIALGPLTRHTGRVRSVAISPDGKKIASASEDRTVRLWDAETGAKLDVFRGHRNWVRSVALSPDGKRVASASEDKTVRIWDATGEWKR